MTEIAEVEAYHHVSLTVTDLGRSVAWYREVLGFEIAAEVEGAGFRRTRLRAPGSGLTLTLTAHTAGHAGPFDERRPGLDHVALQVTDLAALAERFARLGVEHSPTKQTASGAHLITVRDPDRIQLEVFDPRGTSPIPPDGTSAR